MLDAPLRGITTESGLDLGVDPFHEREVHIKGVGDRLAISPPVGDLDAQFSNATMGGDNRAGYILFVT